MLAHSLAISTSPPPARKSCANRVGSATLCHWPSQYRQHHYHHTTTTTATSLLDSNSRDESHTLRASSTQQSLRPRGRTTTAAMSQFVGQVFTTTHYPFQTTFFNPIIPSRPVSPTHAHGTMSTPAPTHALSAAWPPPSPSPSWASTNPSTTPVPTAATTSSSPACPSCTPPARRCRRRSTTRTPPGPVA